MSTRADSAAEAVCCVLTALSLEGRHGSHAEELEPCHLHWPAFLIPSDESLESGRGLVAVGTRA